jgi:hypothetical protein
MVMNDYHCSMGRYANRLLWVGAMDPLFDRSGGVCERCKQEPVRDAHRNGLEELGVCRTCHEDLHGRRLNDSGPPSTLENIFRGMGWPGRRTP